MKIRFVTSAGELIREVSCLSSLNLLAHAQLDELEIGSRCGGFGECGGDRVRVRSGGERLSPPTVAEEKHLSVGELQRGFRLGCQAFPVRGCESQDGVIELEVAAARPA